MTELKDLELLVGTRTPFVFVETTEGARVDELLSRLSARTGRPAYRWTLAFGLQRLEGGGQPGQPNRSTSEPQRLLGHVLSLSQPSFFVLHDLQGYLKDPLVVSQLREIAVRHASVPHTVVVAAPELEAPAELRGASAHLEMSLPGKLQLEEMIHEEAAAWGRQNQKRLQATTPAIAALVRNLMGLSMVDARRLVRHAIHDDGILDESDLPAVMDAKYKLLDQGGVLSFELKPINLDDVAGMQRLKDWLGQRKQTFLADQPPPGLDPPKGLLLLGVQGGGKSLAAKAVAGAWGVPLLRLDFATLYNKYYGETERNLRESLKTAQIMAPCVLWIDEIEKGLSSESGDDGGPGKRILGTLLTWMAERKERVFLVATANDIEALPPELLRKGRFDEIFFVDLPRDAAREAVFRIHLKKRGQDPAAFDFQPLVEASAGFSGAEIEQAVVSGLYAAHARNEKLQTGHIVKELKVTKPLSVVMAEKILYLRAWAAQRTVSADL
jgi:AAA+ superfamily predicted ATPase